MGDDDIGESVSGVASQDERFRLAMENAAIGMCLVSPDGRFISVNAALCEMLGRDADALTASTWQRAHPPPTTLRSTSAWSMTCWPAGSRRTGFSSAM